MRHQHVPNTAVVSLSHEGRGSGRETEEMQRDAGSQARHVSSARPTSARHRIAVLIHREGEMRKGRKGRRTEEAKPNRSGLFLLVLLSPSWGDLSHSHPPQSPGWTPAAACGRWPSATGCRSAGTASPRRPRPRTRKLGSRGRAPARPAARGPWWAVGEGGGLIGGARSKLCVCVSVGNEQGKRWQVK